MFNKTTHILVHELLSEIHVKIHASKQGFSTMASDWLAAVLLTTEYAISFMALI